MTTEEIYQQLNAVFQDVFDDPSIQLTPSTTAADIGGWDSLMHITLLSAVEDEFGVRFDMKATTSMKNVGDMVDYLQQKLR